MHLLIPDKWKLYALVAIAFAVGILGIRAKWISDGETRVRERMAEQQARAAREATEIRNEVEALDRDTLRDRASQWVRNGKR